MCDNDREKPHFSVRTALVLLLSLLTALAAGWLFHAGMHSLPMAFLTGGGAFAGAWFFWDRLIG
ncbi:hypothetical protein GCM10010492_10020 [Saccharothrix mutabilis subsp. mutabilis]|uniref:Uncharacterized protein n=1 Tax=Saccharothrix mutabilis subsp. mutabilis TaxID=66855 RepID=A0ABP3CSL9_9PSEU